MVNQLAYILKDIHIINNIKLIKYLQAKLYIISKSEIGLEIFEFERDISNLNISILTK